MTVMPQANPIETPIPGVAHATWAGQDDGLQQLSVWRQSVAASAATPPHRHDIDEVVLCLSGRGELHIDGKVHPFRGGETLVLPRESMHQIFNVGDQPLEIVGVFGGTPVQTFLPDGSALPLPWRT
ncbi:MAG TPA: cupin domain-containing protein [Burkholderiaceae bacterium]|nr:cupin domain-containing protein [Burkholderiaceae bacterium]